MSQKLKAKSLMENSRVSKTNVHVKISLTLCWSLRSETFTVLTGTTFLMYSLHIQSQRVSCTIMQQAEWVLICLLTHWFCRWRQFITLKHRQTSTRIRGWSTLQLLSFSTLSIILHFI
jgi:hypothetical protein